MLLPRFYALTDQTLSGLSHLDQIARLAQGGATLVQLRDKTSTPREFFAHAQAAVELANSLGIKLIINDRVDIASCVGAHGVHLGQTDLPPTAARELLGAGALIGLSTHSVAQALAALAEPVDYLAIGPVFATGTKAQADPVVGLEGVRRVREVVGARPLVAIGGITLENAGDVISAGADSVAVVSAVLSQPDEIARRCAALLKGNRG